MQIFLSPYYKSIYLSFSPALNIRFYIQDYAEDSILNVVHYNIDTIPEIALEITAKNVNDIESYILRKLAVDIFNITEMKYGLLHRGIISHIFTLRYHLLNL